MEKRRQLAPSKQPFNSLAKLARIFKGISTNSSGFFIILQAMDWKKSAGWDRMN
jgi:hypothetical protein